jgi:hypothetical protein
MRSVFDLVPDFEPRCVFFSLLCTRVISSKNASTMAPEPPLPTAAAATTHHSSAIPPLQHPSKCPWPPRYMGRRYDVVSGEFNHRFWPSLHPRSSITLTNTFMKHRGGSLVGNVPDWLSPLFSFLGHTRDTRGTPIGTRGTCPQNGVPKALKNEDTGHENPRLWDTTQNMWYYCNSITNYGNSIRKYGNSITNYGNDSNPRTRPGHVTQGG